MEMLRACIAEAERARGDAQERQRLREMLCFFEAITTLYQEFRRLPPGAMRGLAHWNGKLTKL